jgi:hypothetical protein
MRARDWRPLLLSFITAGFLLVQAVPAAAQLLSSRPTTFTTASIYDGSIGGTVTNATTGAGVPNAIVSIYSSSGSFLSSAPTNSSGVYIANLLSTGSYYVLTYNSSGLVDQLYNNVRCVNGNVTTCGGTLVAVTAPNAITINFALAPGVAITGDVDSDGKGDLLWRNTQTGDVAVWLMKGATV